MSSTLPALSFLDARTQAFPVLTGAQIDRIRPMGRVRKVQPGEILFEPNDTSLRFFVLLSGSMEIVQSSLEGERAIATHGPGEFTGEMTMISGQRSLVRGRVTEPGEFLELDSETMRALVADLLRSPSDAGRATAFLVLGGNSFGLLAPIVTGYVVAATGSFDAAFVVAGALALVGAVAALVLVRGTLGEQVRPPRASPRLTS